MFNCCVLRNIQAEDELQLNYPTSKDDPIVREISVISPEPKFNRNRRAGVSAQAVTRERLENWEPKSFPKSESEKKDIKKVIENRLQVLFGHLTPESLDMVIDSLELADLPSGFELIRQGDVGDYFYIVKSGTFDIFVRRGSETPSKVATRGSGDSFGELALLYNSPRAATVKSTSPAQVWKLDRDSFQMMLVTESNTKARQYENMLDRIELFDALNKFEKGQVSDMLQCEQYNDGDIIIKQGDLGNTFYLLESGECIAKLRGPNPGDEEIPVKSYKTGDYFGEMALLSPANENSFRRASIYANNGPVSVLVLDRQAFDRVLGPIKDIMKERAKSYVSYAQVSPNIKKSQRNQR
eukprot:GDKJ01032538.1.p1 GENE.GDKJ01032538.1~~GDKJ01032538.1.p1  ORF type:complete len:354 (-),score=57.31 GDKJ01032538.1:482-1543(-)